uniref:Tudor domain-containing protein n=1 Tax=Romanomermis culicivorax TaxID=13658 RepID=A0A915IV37_ROMCU
MSDDIEKFYSDNSSGSKPLVNAIPGTLCAARYSGDDCWYRGFVLNRPKPAVFEFKNLCLERADFYHSMLFIEERVPNEISRPEFEDYIVSPNKMETFPDADWPTIMPICEVFISYGFRPDELFIQKFDTIEEFVNFTERLQKIYKMCPKVKGNNVKIGSPYAAVSVDNGKFYRCVPVEILDDGSVKVQFVDLGICQIMPAYDLHTFPDDDFCSEFLSTGRYVVKAYLIGSQPEKSAGGYSGKVVTFADNYTMTENGSPKKFICKIDRSSVTKNGQSYAVELFYEVSNKH